MFRGEEAVMNPTMNPPMNPTVGCAVFDTAGGFCGIGWNADAAVTRFHLPTSDAARAARGLARRTGDAPMAEPPAAVAEVIAGVRAYFDGARADFTAVALDPGPQEAFPAAVYAHVRRIPWGETTTYGAVARALDAGPEAARDVGQAMARDPLQLLVPCHRVLAAGGRTGGFSAPGGTDAKLRMLALEGNDIAPAQAAFGF
jgi:methylated-DNA-[protein]-cysteine S-methyltransferase